MDDVKLCCRRSPSLFEFMSGQADKFKAEREPSREGGREGEGGGGGLVKQLVMAGGKMTKCWKKKTPVDCY